MQSIHLGLLSATAKTLCPTGSPYQAEGAARSRAAAALIALSNAMSSGVSSNLKLFLDRTAVFFGVFRRIGNLGWTAVGMATDFSSPGDACKRLLETGW